MEGKKTDPGRFGCMRPHPAITSGMTVEDACTKTLDVAIGGEQMRRKSTIVRTRMRTHPRIAGVDCDDIGLRTQ